MLTEKQYSCFCLFGFFCKKESNSKACLWPYKTWLWPYKTHFQYFGATVTLAVISYSFFSDLLSCAQFFLYFRSYLTHLAWNLSKYLRIRVRKMGREGSFWWIINEMKFQWANSATFTLKISKYKVLLTFKLTIVLHIASKWQLCSYQDFLCQN